MIQQYKERSKDSKTRRLAQSCALAQVLSCRIEDLVEYDMSAEGKRTINTTT